MPPSTFESKSWTMHVQLGQPEIVGYLVFRNIAYDNDLAKFEKGKT